MSTPNIQLSFIHIFQESLQEISKTTHQMVSVLALEKATNKPGFRN